MHEKFEENLEILLRFVRPLFTPESVQKEQASLEQKPHDEASPIMLCITT